jgi:hypothetical protein
MRGGLVRINTAKRASIQGFVSSLADLPAPIRISQSELLGNKDLSALLRFGAT